VSQKREIQNSVTPEEKLRQKTEFEAQIDFAVKYNKPLMIHCRDAHEDCLTILEQKKLVYGDKLRANFHFFTSPIEIVKRILDLGFTVSFTGPITFSKELEEVVHFVPLESMMAETDSPYAAPAPHRGKRNEPLFVKDIVAKIAEIKNLELEIVKNAMVSNAKKFFSI
jgi:TatD DNase family protein